MKGKTMNRGRSRKNKIFWYPIFLTGFLIVGLCLLFTFSYAIEDPPLTNNGEINTLEISMSDGGEGITVNNMEPMNDDEGKSMIDYMFTVINQGPSKGTYQILIEDLAIGEIKDGCSIETLLSRNQLRYQLSLDENQISLRDLNEVKMNVLDIQEIGSGVTHQFSLRLWVPESASKTEWMNKHYHYKITIQQ